jgi:serine/threonine protein kinase
VLQQVAHPFIVSLRYAFHNESSLFLVLDFIRGGDLYHHMELVGRFEEPAARVIAAEIVLAVGHLHARDIAFRDLKVPLLIHHTPHHIKRVMSRRGDRARRRAPPRAGHRLPRPQGAAL